MELLDTLTLVNVLDTALHELISVLPRVHTLRNLTLPKPNPKGMGLLCQWLHTCKLKILIIFDSPVCSKYDKPVYHKLTVTSGNEEHFLIETIDCTNCTLELINLVLSQMQASGLAMVHVKSLVIVTKYLQPLPLCLPALISRMERLKMLTLVKALNTSLIGLLPVLFRHSTLGKVRLHKLKSEGIALLCQQLPSCQLKKLKVYDLKVYDLLVCYESRGFLPIITFTFSNFHNIETIECVSWCTANLKVTDRVLSQIAQSSLAHVKSMTIASSCAQSQQLAVHLPKLLPRMERLNTLILKITLDISQRGLLQALSKVSTLRELEMQSIFGNLEMLFPVDSVLLTGTITGTSNFIDQFLPHLPQQYIAHIESLTIKDPQEDPQSLPPGLLELIPGMERLTTLTLKNVLGTSLTELIPLLSGAPTLRNLTIPKLNSKGFALLRQWLPAYQLETLRVCEENDGRLCSSVTFIYSRESSSLNIEIKECKRLCTKDFINHVISKLPTFEVLLCVKYAAYPHSLPPSLMKFIPRVERLNSLTLENVHDTSLTELIPALSKVLTLKNLILPKLNSEGIDLLCEWLPTCQLKKFRIHKYKMYDNISFIVVFTIDGETRSYQIDSCTSEFVEKILLQVKVSDQLITHVKSIIIIGAAKLPPLTICLPELIPKMEKLDTLTLTGVDDTSLTELMPVLCKVPTLRNLTLPKLTSESIVILCQWLPTCQLETFYLPSLSPDHIEMVQRALTKVSSLKIVTICGSKFTLQSMQAFVFILPWNQSLTEVNINHCSISSDSACCLAEAIYHNTTIRKLHMSGNPVGEKAASAMAEMLKHNTILEELNISHAQISSDGAVVMTEALHENSTLRKMDMSGNPVGERGALAMAEMLKHNITLEKLDSSDADISSDGTVAIAEALCNNMTLRKLDLKGNPVREMGSLAMAEMLNQNTALFRLCISNTEISSDGAVAMAEALHHNKTLRKLDISWNPVGKNGTLAMAEMIKHNTTLEKLDFRCSDVDKRAIKALLVNLVVNHHLKKIVLCDHMRLVESLSIYHYHRKRVELKSIWM